MPNQVNSFFLAFIVSIFMNDTQLLAFNSSRAQKSLENALPYSKIIVVEGMPGAGKTSALAALAEELEGTCVLLSEMNLEPNAPERNLLPKEKGAVFHKLWVERMEILKTFKDPDLCFLLDRSPISNLAFIYALDSIEGTHNYPLHKKTFEESFSQAPFELILVFDITPEIGLERRMLRGDKIPWPWSDLNFLKALRQFYQEELSKYAQGKIKVIDAGKDHTIVQKEVTSIILSFLNKNKNPSFPYLVPHTQQIETLHTFAETHKLGKASTRIINVLGIPTLYFLKHSLQLERGQPVFFNNQQLYKIALTYHSLKSNKAAKCK